MIVGIMAMLQLTLCKVFIFYYLYQMVAKNVTEMPQCPMNTMGITLTCTFFFYVQNVQKTLLKQCELPDITHLIKGLNNGSAKKSRETTFLVSAEWNLRARSSQTGPDLSLILLGKASISVQFQKLKAKIATMKLALRFNASVNLKITWQKSKVSFISRIHPSLARYTFRQSTGKAIGINYFVQLI